jgi:sarcosine oxidase
MRVAVVGAGIVGSATAAYLLDAGADVTCYEAVAPMSGRSAGASRIFRLAHGTPELVRLAQASLDGYRAWGERAGAELIDHSGLVVTGPLVDAWPAAMSAAGAEYRLTDRLDLPILRVPGRALVDPAGGVLDAHSTGRYLTAKTTGVVVRERVDRLEHHDDTTRVWTAAGPQDFDATVICAGAGTAVLAGQVGIPIPAEVGHHARFSFRLRDPAAHPPCILEYSGASVGTYQHLTGPGLWAVGAHLPADEVAWTVGRANVVARARDVTSRYVRENLDGVEDKPVEELYCTFPVDWGDGYIVERRGGFLAVHGDNLFKLAPVLGRLLGEAALHGTTPEPTHAGRGGSSLR